MLTSSPTMTMTQVGQSAQAAPQSPAQAAPNTGQSILRLNSVASTSVARTTAPDRFGMRSVSPSHIQIAEQENPAPPPPTDYGFGSLLRLNSLPRGQITENITQQETKPIEFINTNNDLTLVQSIVREPQEPLTYVNENQKSFSESGSRKGSRIVAMASELRNIELPTRPGSPPNRASSQSRTKYPASRQKLIQVPTFNYGEPAY